MLHVYYSKFSQLLTVKKFENLSTTDKVTICNAMCYAYIFGPPCIQYTHSCTAYAVVGDQLLYRDVQDHRSSVKSTRIRTLQQLYISG